MSAHFDSIRAATRDTMGEFNNDRTKVIEALVARKDNPALNEMFRVLGIHQAVRNAQTVANSLPTYQGIACSKCGGSERYTKCGACVSCARRRQTLGRALVANAEQISP